MSSDQHDTRRRTRREQAAERRDRAAERRERTRARGRARHALSAEAIVETGLRIADEDGLEAVSMRRIASELSVGTMSLYHHVSDKDELLELMADAISAELLVPGEILGDWRAARYRRRGEDTTSRAQGGRRHDAADDCRAAGG